MEQAIKIAIENGWTLEQRLNALGVLKSVEAICLDPLFWQALVKKEGVFAGKPYWLWAQHDFIDHLSEGKDIESFFNNLIK